MSLPSSLTSFLWESHWSPWVTRWWESGFMWRFWSIWQWIQSIGDGGGGGGGLGFLCWSFEVGGGISQLGFSSEWVVV